MRLALGALLLALGALALTVGVLAEAALDTPLFLRLQQAHVLARQQDRARDQERRQQRRDGGPPSHPLDGSLQGRAAPRLDRAAVEEAAQVVGEGLGRGVA